MENDKEKGNWSEWITSKREDYAQKAEDHLNEMPINKRKKVFFIVFGVFGLIVLTKLVMFVFYNIDTPKESESSSSKKGKTEQKVTEKDIMKIDIIPEVSIDEKTKRGVEKMIEDMRKTDSLEKRNGSN